MTDDDRELMDESRAKQLAIERNVDEGIKRLNEMHKTTSNEPLPTQSPEPQTFKYFVYYTAEVMGKRIHKSKIFQFEAAISQESFDGIAKAIAQHDNVGEITICNFIPMGV